MQKVETADHKQQQQTKKQQTTNSKQQAPKPDVLLPVHIRRNHVRQSTAHNV